MEWLPALMALAVLAVLMAGVPVAFALAGTALAFAGAGIGLGLFGTGYLHALAPRVWGILTSDTLLAIPLFVLMGVLLERSRVAEDLIETCAKLFGGLPGGLAISVSFVGALLAATTGIVGADVVALGLIALPTMLRHGYSPALAAGSVAAAGTLAQLIPPSIVLIVLGDQLSGAWQAAQLAKGTFAPDVVSIGDLFAGALLPGLLLVVLYMAWQFAIALARPQYAPVLPASARDLGPRPWATLAAALLPPVLLIVAVMGSILGGVATPTEAAGVGAAGSLLLAARRIAPERAGAIHAAGLAILAILMLTALFDLRSGRTAASLADRMAMGLAGVALAVFLYGFSVALLRTARAGLVSESARRATDIATMIFAIMLGATLFALVFRGLGGDAMVGSLLSGIPGGTAGAVLTVMALMFVLGFFLDFIEIVFIVVPLVAPVLFQMEGIDPVWLGVMMALNLQTSFLTPPVGASLFYLRSVAPASVTTGAIYRGVAPFVVLQLVALVLLWFFPALATALPRWLYG